MAFPFFLMFGRKLLRDAIMKRVAFWFEKENIQKPKNLPKLELMAVEYGNSYRKQFIQDYTVRSCFVIGRWSSDDVNIFFPYPWTCFGHESHLMAFHLGLCSRFWPVNQYSNGLFITSWISWLKWELKQIKWKQKLWRKYFRSFLLTSLHGNQTKMFSQGIVIK